jgi:hypothetical protein
LTSPAGRQTALLAIEGVAALTAAAAGIVLVWRGPAMKAA